MFRSLTLLCLLLVSSIIPATAQMVSGDRMVNYDTVFGLGPGQKAKGWSVTQVGSSLGSNVVHPGEQVELTFRFQNLTAQPLQMDAALEVIPYGATTAANDSWTPILRRDALADVQRIPVPLKIEAKASQTVTIAIPIPERFGSYAVIADLGDKGRAFAATLARVITPDEEAVAFPAYALDMPRYVTPSSMNFFKRIGAKASRMEIGPFDPDAPDAAQKWADLDRKFQLMRANNVTVMLTVDNGSLPQPTGKPRPHLDAQDIQLNTKTDGAWLPEYDGKFREWIRIVASRWGYPKGPVNAMELWNEPWEGISISGWGADMLRYREIYRAMAGGIQQARKESGVQVLMGGASSSTNTLDKLFPDGSDEFLPILDFASIHYQMMAAAPALVKPFRERKPAPVQTWDTETWIANSEDRVALVVASMRAMGQDRVLGIFSGNVYEAQLLRADGKEYDAMQAWNITPAIAAVTKFIGNRTFTGLLFQNGLPWVFCFDGAPDGAEAAAKNVDNGTLVVVGDLSAVYDRNLLPFRDVLGLKNIPAVAAAEKEYAQLPKDATAAVHKEADAKRASAKFLTGATLTFSDNGGKFRAFDFSGNPLPARDGKLIIPLDTLGYYLRSDGSPGSFAALKAAVSAARVEGYEPLHIIAHDFIAPVNQHPTLRLELTNILNRPVQGTLNVHVENLKLDGDKQAVTFAANETKTVILPVIDGKERSDNAYELMVSFDAGKVGTAEHSEMLRCNVIAAKTITVDGDLGDWTGAIPQPVGGQGIAINATEKAWLPFVNFDEGASGTANGYMAYDADNFYFAAKIADSTPDAGSMNFATRNDDQFFYPPIAYQLNVETSLQKKDTVAAADTSETRALQKPEGISRIRAYYETTTTKSFAIDLDAKNDQAFQVALYFVDGIPRAPRQQTIQMLDETGKVLDSRDIKSFGEGCYLVYAVKGKVRFRIFRKNNLSALLSAVFFDSTTETSSKFLMEDDATSGNWKGKYGALGYHFAAAGIEKIPANFSLSVPELLDKTPLEWPKDVRRYSYRMRPIQPFNTGDDVQIAFNVLPDEAKPWLMNPPGVPPKWMLYPDTDYEYSLLQNAPQYGGKTEVWRLSVPGMPHKNFYPRQPKWPGNERWKEGDVSNAKLAMKREGNTRVVELSLPWSEIPDVKARLDAGKTIKFSFRVGDNGGQPYELAQDRSVSKSNFYAFHPDYNTHWANEVEFGWEK